MNATCVEERGCICEHTEESESLILKAVRLAEGLEQSVKKLIVGADQNLGEMELEVERQSRDFQRAATQKAAQAKADVTPPVCPVCQEALSRVSGGHERTFESRFGAIRIERKRGYCKRCKKWRFPADHALGLEETAGYSPRVQEMAALLASKMPVEEASAVMEHLTGVKMPRATLDREAKRQGERARRLRDQMDKQVDQACVKGVQPEMVLEPYQMIIQIDAWNIRERDGWGQTERLRRAGQEPERWHWVYVGTCFRLNQRGKTAGGRAVISERGFVATRAGIDALRQQLHAEAMRRGLGQAAGALVIADGAVWIWRLADDRFPQARQRLDYYHAVQHLAAVGRALFGQDKDKLRDWLRPLVKQLKNQWQQKSSIGWKKSWEPLRQARPGLRRQKRSIIYASIKIGWITELVHVVASPLAAVPLNPHADKPNAALSVRANIGASKVTRRYYVWKRFGEITVGICFFLITAILTHLKTEMRP